MRTALLALLVLFGAAPAGAAERAAWHLREVAIYQSPEGAASLGEATGVAVDAFGHVWATDAAGHRVVRWDAQGHWLGESGSLGSDANQFRRPTALTRLGSLGVAVLDEENRRVRAFDQLGRTMDFAIALDAPELEAVTGRVRPAGLTADRGGQLYVLDADRDRVLVFSFEGRYLRALGGYGQGAGAFHGLAAVAVAAHGELVTVERAQSAPHRGRGAVRDSARAGTPARVQWLDAGGSALAAWTFDDGGARDFGVAVDDSGRVALTLAGGHADAVCLYRRDGTLIARTTDVASPRGIAFAPDGALLVAEAGAERVRRFTLAPPPGE